MGIKKLSIFLAISLLIVLFFSQAIIAQPSQQQSVRVSISDTAFKVFQYDKVSIFGTEEYNVYNLVDKTKLLTIPKDEKTDFVIKDGKLSLIYKDQKLDLTNDVVIDCKDGFLGITNLKRRGSQALYHGAFEIVKNQKGNLFFVINVLDIQDYLKGVVPNEMPVRFGLEALKAQSVAARNYVLSPRTKAFKEFDVGDSVASQVYFGVNSEDALATKAVNETEGLVALHNWNLILAQYSSTAGGYTESFDNVFLEPLTKIKAIHKPYLIAKPDIIMQPPLLTEDDVRKFYTTSPDSYDMLSPYYRWKKSWTKDELQEVLKKTLVSQSKTGFISPKISDAEDLGNILEFRPKKRGDSGKLVEMEIVTDKGIYSVSKELVIRRVFQKNNISLPSANIVFDYVYNDKKELSEIIISGGGFGHGVGMSQYGAGFMSEKLKMSFDKILKHYYTDIVIGTQPIILSSYKTQKQACQKFYFASQKAILVIDNRFNLNKLNMEINGKEIVLPLDTGILENILRLDITKYLKKGENTVFFNYPSDEGSTKAIRLYIEMVIDDNRFLF